MPQSADTNTKDRLTRTDFGDDIVFTLRVPSIRADAVERVLEGLLDAMRVERRERIPAVKVPTGLRISQTLKALRLERGLSQKALATAVHTTQAQISSFEMGTKHIPQATAEELAKFFKRPLEDFMR